MTSPLIASGVTVGYDDRTVIESLTLEVPRDSFTVIIGPNACGKSTLLRSLARLLPASEGAVILDGREIAEYRSKEVARRLGLLPQTSIAPDGITVVDLVSRGRFPHQGLLRQWSAADEAAIVAAMTETSVLELAQRSFDELSGGQRQRVWVAMALAQETPLLLLDEPTTYLDINHQLELLDLFAALRAAGGRTLVAVLHDLNQAARYASHLVVMKAGRIVAEGSPSEILTAELVDDVFGVACRIIDDPESHTPLVVPKVRAHQR